MERTYTSEKDHWVPTAVRDLDLLTDLDGEDGPVDRPVLALVRVHGRCLGTARLEPAEEATLRGHRERLRSAYRREVREHVERFGCDAAPEVAGASGEPACLVGRRSLVASAPAVSVLVATHDRPHLLRRCLGSLLQQDHPATEIIVVDNARSSDDTERLVKDEFADHPVRYVREDVPGLGRAHNTGAAYAQGRILAITDDDVVVDRHWVSALLESFVLNGAGCVTGLIVPLELRTREQMWVEQYGGFSRGFSQRAFSLTCPPSGDPLFPFAPGRWGSGANMAFDRAVLESIGGFDPALGAGTRARGGDDLASFARAVLAGATLAYQPDAVVFHEHRSDYAALRQMAHGYGVGLGAYLTSVVAAKPLVGLQMVRRLPAGVRHLASPSSEKNRSIRRDYPRELVVSERLGLLRGPFSYVASRWDSRAADARDSLPKGRR
jgi:GT2 family glycosyltransferase